MNYLPVIPACFLIFLTGCASSGEKSESVQNTIMLSVDKMDPDLDQWVGDSVEAEVIGEGYQWSEGPVWVEELEMLLFSDVPVNTVFSWSESGGTMVYLKPSGYTGDKPREGEMGSNGLILDHNGSLLLCQHGDRRVARMNAPLSNPAADFETLADSYDGGRLNSPNDLVLDSEGNIYVTDPPYGLEQRMDDPEKELPFQGVYRIGADGMITLLIDSIARPNGIELSPDEKFLYVGNSGEKPYWLRYTISGDSLLNGKVFLDASDHYQDARGPDGMYVAENGTIISSGHGGIWFIGADGTFLGRINIPQAVSNCTLDESSGNLFVTADHQVLRIPLLLPE